MQGETVRILRKEKAWSQAHLAQAAGVSVRTVQRVEREGQCSDETLLSIAAALDVDVQFLTQGQLLPVALSSGQDRTDSRYLWPELDPKSAARWGGVLAAPGLLFVVSNVLKYHLGLPHLYDGLARLAETTGLAQFDGFLTSPLLLLGGPILSVLMNGYAQVRARGDRHGKEVSIEGVDISIHHGALLVLAISLACVVVMLGYATLENVAGWIGEIVNQ